jgi:hypothetical protein
MSNLGRQWQQLDMYKTAKELRATRLGDVETAKIWDAGRTPAHELEKNVMDQKLTESRASGLYDSIAAHGVSKPVYISNIKPISYEKSSLTGVIKDINPAYVPPSGEIIMDGHHRIAAAHDINPNMIIPVEHG